MAAVAAIALAGMGTANAQTKIAVFGDNATDDFINGLAGYQAVLVSDMDLATPGFLTGSGFSAFYFTRNGASFGSGLSVAAAANVASYVGLTGNVVLLNGDFADGIGNASINQLTSNSVMFAAASGNGFIGEFNGAVSALTANSNGFTPLSLIPGTAGPLGLGNGGSQGSLNQTAAGAGSPVLAGLSFPFNPVGVDFGSVLTGVPNALVVATFDGGNPGIIVRQGTAAPGNAIPEPGTLALASTGLIGLIGCVRRRKAAA